MNFLLLASIVMGLVRIYVFVSVNMEGFSMNLVFLAALVCGQYQAPPVIISQAPKVIELPKVQKESVPQVIPFQSKRHHKPRIAEGLLDPLVKWGLADVDGKLQEIGFQHYRPATKTQAIYVLNTGSARFDRIDPTPRTMLPPKVSAGITTNWQKPGGLENATGYESKLYKYLPEEPRTYVADIQVLNSFGYFQPNRGWKRQYKDGTIFVDVLSKDGTVFELRTAEKIGDKWHRSIEYRDRSNRPHGFTKISATQCNECHSEAGTGGYAVGLIPGGDTIISDPFAALEK